MKTIKNEILIILTNHQVDEMSSTGTTGEFIIYAESYEDIANEIISLFQAITDPENQPNQYNIKI